MSKELEAFEKIKLGYICGQGAINEFALRENERENFNTLEIALKTLEMFKHHPNPILLMAVIEKYIMELDYTWEEYDEVFKFEPIKEREIYCQEDYETLRKVFRKCELD